MASDPFADADYEAARDRHLECEGETLHTWIENPKPGGERPVVWYQCIECRFEFSEFHGVAKRFVINAFRITVPVVHPSKYQPGV